MNAWRWTLTGVTTSIVVAGALQGCGADGDNGDGGTDASKPESGKDVHAQGDTSPGDAGGDSGGCPSGKTLCGGSCIDDQTDPKNCGGCGLACSVACVKGECLETLAMKGGPAYVALDSKNVYWTSTGTCTGDGGAAVATGTVMAMPLAGGTPTTLASGQPDPEAIAADGTSVYWANNVGSSCAAAGGSVVKISPDGGTITTLASNQPSAKFVAVDSKNIYWTTSDGILSAPLGGVGDGGTPTALASGQGPSAGIAVEGTNVYWAQGGGKGNVLSVPVAGGKIATITSAKTACSAGCISFTADSKYAYYAFMPPEDYANYEVISIPLSGGPAFTIADNEANPANMASDGTNLYWTNYGDIDGADHSNSVVRAPPTSTATVVIASGLANPRGVAVNATSVYWANSGNSTDPGGGIEKATPK
jgi:hypothetical protein